MRLLDEIRRSLAQRVGTDEDLAVSKEILELIHSTCTDEEYTDFLEFLEENKVEVVR